MPDVPWSDVSHNPYTQPNHAQYCFGQELAVNDFLNDSYNDECRPARHETVPFRGNDNPFTPRPQANHVQSAAIPRYIPGHSSPFNYPPGFNNYPTNPYPISPPLMNNQGGSYYLQPEFYPLSSGTLPENDYLNDHRYQPTYAEPSSYQPDSAQPASLSEPRRPRRQPRRSQEPSAERSTDQKPKKKRSGHAKVQRNESNDQDQMMSNLLDKMEERFKFGARLHDVWSDPGILREMHRMRTPSAFSQYTSDDRRSSSSRRERNTDQLLNKLVRLLEQSDPRDHRDEHNDLLEDRMIGLLEDRLNSNDRTMLQTRNDRTFRSKIEQVVEDILERRSFRDDSMQQRLAPSEINDSGGQQAPSRIRTTTPSDWQREDATRSSSQNLSQYENTSQNIRIEPDSEITHKLGRHRSFTVRLPDQTHPRKNNPRVVITLEADPDLDENSHEENLNRSLPPRPKSTRLSTIDENAGTPEWRGSHSGSNTHRGTQRPAVNTGQPRSRGFTHEPTRVPDDQYSEDDSVFVPERPRRRYQMDRVHQDRGLRQVPHFAPDPPHLSQRQRPEEYS